VLLDIGLPVFSGFQVFEEFKLTGSTPVLAVTAYCQEKDIKRFLNAGFRAVLPKPVDSAVLLNKVASLLTMPIPSI
jgi:DNA-binding response OmpR family regulator